MPEVNTNTIEGAIVATVDELGTVKPIVIMLDQIIHDQDHPFCSDSTCPCQNERERQRTSLPLNGNRPFSLLR
jgi:hypothetical protein